MEEKTSVYSEKKSCIVCRNPMGNDIYIYEDDNRCKPLYSAKHLGYIWTGTRLTYGDKIDEALREFASRKYESENEQKCGAFRYRITFDMGLVVNATEKLYVYPLMEGM